MNTIKELFYFDEFSDEIHNHKGGAASLASMAMNKTETKDLKHVDEKELSAGMLDFWSEIVEIAKDNFKRVYNIFIGWVLTPIIFGSFAPALPFFLVMGVLYAIFNYLQKLIEKL
jgi:hypothetical protein